jgi:hypothetical protein
LAPALGVSAPGARIAYSHFYVSEYVEPGFDTITQAA